MSSTVFNRCSAGSRSRSGGRRSGYGGILTVADGNAATGILTIIRDYDNSFRIFIDSTPVPIGTSGTEYSVTPAEFPDTLDELDLDYAKPAAETKTRQKPKELEDAEKEIQSAIESIKKQEKQSFFSRLRTNQ